MSRHSSSSSLSSSSSPPSSSSSLWLSLTTCTPHSYCCEYCELDRVESTSHDEHCLHPPDSPALHFLLHDGSQQWPIHAACLHSDLIHHLLPLADYASIDGYSTSTPSTQLLIRRLVLLKLSEFYQARDSRVQRWYNREGEAFADRVVDKLTCALCHLTLYHPVELGCGHLLCEGCWVQCIRHSKDTDGDVCPCPVCRRAVRVDRVRSSPALQLLIEGLQVRCVHHLDGCSDLITVGKDERNLHSHLRRCLHEEVQCDECGLDLRRHQLRRHQLDDCVFLCPSCHHQVRSSQRKLHRVGLDADLCVDALYCPNHCDDSRTMHVNDIAEHRETTCPEESIECDVCGDRYRRREEAAHMQGAVTKHVRLLQKQIAKDRVEIAELRGLVQLNKASVDHLRPRGSRASTPQEHSRKRRRSLSNLPSYRSAPAVAVDPQER